MKVKDIFIDAGKIYLRMPEKKDLKGDWYSWLNDPVVTRYQNKGIVPNTRKKQEEYLLKMLNSKNDIIFAIIEKKTGRHIGSTGLHKIDWIHRSAELGIVIGRKESWGKGYGKAAWNAIAYYGFKVLNLHRIYATIFKDNIASLRSAKASCFKAEGLMRQVFFKNGKYHNAFLVSALEGEFKKI